MQITSADVSSRNPSSVEVPVPVPAAVIDRFPSTENVCAPTLTFVVETDYATEAIQMEAVAKCSRAEVILAAKALWGEARGCSKEEQMLVIWCMCNRADAWDQSIEEVVTAPHQFVGYSPDNPVDEELVAVVEEVMNAWSMGQGALVHEPFATSSEYLFFYGDGQHNWFREEF